MAKPLQHGSVSIENAIEYDARSSLVLPVVTLQPLGEAQEVLRLDTSPSVISGRAGLPGVDEERRFHNYYPQVLIDNTLLRNHLREDFYQTDHVRSACKFSTRSGQIVLGYAAGAQHRLHQAVMILSGTESSKINVALTQQNSAKLCHDSQETVVHTVDIDPSTVTQQTIFEKIVGIHACSGTPTSMFVLWTKKGVQCLSLYQEGDKRSAIEVRRVFEAGASDFHGRNPIACAYQYSGRWALHVLTEDNVVRVWRTPKYAPTTSKHIIYEYMSAIEIRMDGHIARDLFLKQDEVHNLHILMDDRVMLMSTSAKSLSTVFRARAGESLLKMSFTQAHAGLHHFACIVSNHRVILIEQLPTTLVEKASWPHQFRADLYFDVHLLHFLGSVSIMLNLKSGPLCVMYNAQIEIDAVSSSSPSRITFPEYTAPEFLFPYVCTTSSNDSEVGIVYGFLYSGKNMVLQTTILSAKTDLTMVLNRPQRPTGPAFILSQDNTRWMTHGVENNTKVDLRRFYNTVVYHMQPRADKSQSAASTQVTSSFHCKSRDCRLAYEFLNKDFSNYEDFDDDLECNMHAYSDTQGIVSEVPGLSLHKDLYDASEPESFSAKSIMHKLSAWQRKGTITHAQNTSWQQQSQIAAMSLSLATISLRPVQMNHLESVEKQLFGAVGEKPSINRNIEIFLNDWEVSADPTNYEWLDLARKSEQISRKQFQVADIPAFRAPAPAPPIVASASSQVADSSQVVQEFPATQPVPGKFGSRASKRKRKAGFR